MKVIKQEETLGDFMIVDKKTQVDTGTQDSPLSQWKPSKTFTLSVFESIT